MESIDECGSVSLAHDVAKPECDHNIAVKWDAHPEADQIVLQRQRHVPECNNRETIEAQAVRRHLYSCTLVMLRQDAKDVLWGIWLPAQQQR